MTRLPSIGPLCWKLCCGSVSCLNFLFIGLALLQTGIILFNAAGRSVPLPGRLSALLADHLLPETLSLKWNRAYFDLRGGCLLQGVEIHHRANGERLLTAEFIRFNLAIPNLLLRSGPPVEEIETTAATLYAPAPVSASGTNDPLLALQEARLSLKGKDILLHRAIADSSSAALVMRGTFPASLLFSSGQDQRPALIPLLAKLDQQLRALDQVEASLTLSSPATERDALTATLFASGQHRGFSDIGPIAYQIIGQFGVGANRELRLESLMGDLSLTDPAPVRQLDLPLLGRLTLPLRVAVRSHNDPNPLPFPSTPTLSFRLIEPFGAAAQLSSLEVSVRLPLAGQPLKWRASGQGLAAAGTAFLDPAASDSSLKSVVGWTRLRSPRLREWIPTLPDHRLLNETRADHLETSLRWEAVSGQVCGSSTLRGVAFDGASIPYAESDWTADASTLQIDRFAIDISFEQALSGNFQINFSPATFTFGASGNILPETLDPFLGAWWAGIFQHISVIDPVQANVALSGILGKADSLQSVVETSSKSASYRGVAIPDLHLLIRSNHHWAFLESLKASFGKTAITGQMAWQQGLPDHVRRPMLLTFKSNAPWSVVRPASGIAELSSLDFTAAPILELEGWIYRPPRANRSLGPIPALDIDLVLPNGRLRFKEMDFKQVVLNATVKNQEILIEPLSGSFGNGIFTGSLTLRKDPRNRQNDSADLDFQLIDAGFIDTINDLSPLTKDPEQFLASFSKTGKSGRLNAEFTLHMTPNRDDWTGSGQFSIQNTRLGQIHLLGGLSKILNTIGLGFTSLDINGGNLQWTLAENTLHIPQSLFTGTLLSLRLDGTLFLPTNELTLRADVNLFKGLVSKVLTPVSDNIQLDLSGTLQDPRWTIRLSPLRWFTNRLTEGLAPPP